jgi:hypothetical protein
VGGGKEGTTARVSVEEKGEAEAPRKEERARGSESSEKMEKKRGCGLGQWKGFGPKRVLIFLKIFLFSDSLLNSNLKQV